MSGLLKVFIQAQQRVAGECLTAWESFPTTSERKLAGQLSSY